MFPHNDLHLVWDQSAERINGSGETDTFFAHAHTETLLQATVLALVPVVLVYLTLSVGPETQTNGNVGDLLHVKHGSCFEFTPLFVTE